MCNFSLKRFCCRLSLPKCIQFAYLLHQ
uniref:Uncharacterized protein n=1 Tax=Anguilla anguilla TaxID=7936 RepID=A0A0E9XA31_ANGAN